MDTPDDRVRQLIASSGLRHGDFAQRVGLDPSKLSKSLSGARRFSSLDLARIADLARVSVDWILTGTEPELATAARAASGTSAGDALSLARRLTGIRSDLAFLGFGRSWTPVAAPTGRWADQGESLARTAVDRVRERGFEPTAQDLPEVVETVFGVDVAVQPLGDGFDGLAVAADDARLILLAPTNVPGRQRFTLAHELAHLLAADDQGVHVDEDIFGAVSSRGDSEMRANAFAAAFLMPADVLQHQVDDGGLGQKQFCALAVRLGVSPSTLAIRLAKLRLVDETTCDRWRRISGSLAAQAAGAGPDFARAVARARRVRPPGLLVLDAYAAYEAGAATLRLYAEVIGADVNQLRTDLEARDSESDAR